MRGAGLWLALAGCPGRVEPGPGTLDTGYTYYYSSYYTGYYSSFFSGPVEITSAGADCTADLLTVSVQTAGWTSEGRVFVQETGAPVDPQWVEEHPLYSVQFAADGSWDQLEVRLATEVLPNEVAPGGNTAFSCAFSDQLTYLVAVTDLNGYPADCVAFGHDPQGLIDGVYDRFDEPSFSMLGCSSY
jgi:hypothetical protein